MSIDKNIANYALKLKNDEIDLESYLWVPLKTDLFKNEFTIEFELLPITAGMIFSYQQVYTNDSIYVHLDSQTKILTFFCFGIQLVVKARQLFDEKWHRVTCVHINLSAYIYIDNKLVISQGRDGEMNKVRTEGSSDFVPKMFIGAVLYPVPSVYNGYLDNIRIWSRSLSKSEITECNHDNPLMLNKLEGYWSFDQQNVEDLSDNKHHAEMSGNLTFIPRQSEQNKKVATYATTLYFIASELVLKLTQCECNKSWNCDYTLGDVTFRLLKNKTIEAFTNSKRPVILNFTSSDPTNAAYDTTVVLDKDGQASEITQHVMGHLQSGILTILTTHH